MALKDSIKRESLNIMRLRARGMSTAPRTILEDQLHMLEKALVMVTQQRDELMRAYNEKFFEEKTNDR